MGTDSEESDGQGEPQARTHQACAFWGDVILLGGGERTHMGFRKVEC